MPFLQGRVTEITDYREIIEFPEAFRLIAFL
jgi:hypothetical protein